MLNPNVDLDLATICLKCLAKEPGERYSSAAALADELGRWRIGEPIRARPPSLVTLARSLTRRYGRAALWVLAVGLIVGLLNGFHTYATDIQTGLTWDAGAYAALPSASPPWLAGLGFIPLWLQSVLGLCMLLFLGSMGLLAVLRIRPRHTAADIGVGLAVGAIAGIVALGCGTGWALIYGTALSSTFHSSEYRTLVEIGLQRARPSDAPLQIFRDEYGRKTPALKPGWQLDKYPGLRDIPLREQAALLHRKFGAELIVSVQKGIWYSLFAVSGFLLLGAAEAAVAGGLLRQYGRVGAILPAYAEVVGPCVASVYAALALAVNLMEARDSFRPATWSTVLGLAVLAMFAAIRRWPWWARLGLQAAWLTAMAMIVSGVWLPHAP
jgi:hypothetical protein